MVAEDILGNLMESLYIFLMTKGNDYKSLPKYLNVVEYRYNIPQEYGFNLAIDYLRDDFMVELLS